MFHVQREKVYFDSKYSLLGSCVDDENSYNSSLGCRKAKLHTAVSLPYIQLHMHEIYVV